MDKFLEKQNFCKMYTIEKLNSPIFVQEWDLSFETFQQVKWPTQKA